MTSTSTSTVNGRLGVEDMYPDEEPPPYTPTPAANTGEQSLEYGPRRPVQRPVQPLTQPVHLQYQLTGTLPTTSQGRIGTSFTGGGGGGGGGSILRQLTSSINNVVREITGPSPSPAPLRQDYTGWSSRPVHIPPPPPPPRHPSSLLPPSSPPLPPRRPTLSSASSDFARDFYAAGDADPVAQSIGPSTSAPLTHQRTGSTGLSTAPNDARPTTHPTPGHPLLKDGKLLVYPKGHECDKCHNTGYKSSDPGRPCKKCWSKYAKPFSGPLAYSFSSSGNDTETATNFQRPLPLHPPSSSGGRLFKPPRMGSDYPGRAARPPPSPIQYPPPPGPPPPPNLYHPQPHTRTFIASTPTFTSRPPPNAQVYMAGDPRIGGRLCWRCDGRGNNSFLFERLTCEVCGGAGRVFE